ncbi:cobalamin biosynthesis protein [Beggiatoa alba]|nr:cobalamin biosynthesis protein [Beggiatoa alba]
MKKHAKLTKAVIFSLTDGGEQLARQLLVMMPDAELCHKSVDFIASAQQHFSQGDRCVFICATGIVVRALGPVLKDKHSDPAVLVLDEKGQYVIPLLCGHEGGANVWAADIAAFLNANLVITSARDYTQPVYVIGMGCDKGCPEELLFDLLEQAKPQLNHKVSFAALGSIDIKHNEQGLVSIASRLDIPFKYYAAENLRQVEDQLSVKSDIVFKEVGCYGVAEAAALLAASELTGNTAELVVTKLKNKRATLAIARSYY